MASPEQLPLPVVFEGAPDPTPRPDRRVAVAVQRKPVEREAGAVHPQREQKQA